MASLYRHRFKLLLGTLLALILAMPVLFEALAETAPKIGLALAMVAAALVISGRRGARWFAYGLLAPSLVVEAGAVFLWPNELLFLHFALRIAFVSFVIGAILREIFLP